MYPVNPFEVDAHAHLRVNPCEDRYFSGFCKIKTSTLRIIIFIIILQDKTIDMYIKNEDTICAPATVPGTGAISVIRVSGPEALTIADKVISCKKGNISGASGYTIKFGTVSDESGAVLDEVLASVFRAPHSYTGENRNDTVS